MHSIDYKIVDFVAAVQFGDERMQLNNNLVWSVI